MATKFKYFLYLLILFSHDLFAGVNLKNGNFYIEYTDIIVESGIGFEIRRTYNSKSVGMGWFGLGWGSYFETFFIPQIDGSILFYENGSGGKTWFYPEKNNLAVSDSVILRKVANLWFEEDKERKYGTVLNDYVSKILSDKENQAKYWHKYINQFKINPFYYLSDSVFISTSRGVQYLKIDKGGITRTGGGKTEYYNEKGKLIKVEGASGIIEINYENEKAVSISDNLGNSLFLFYNQSGQIERIVSNTGTSCIYNYSAKGELIFFLDNTRKEIGYEYDDFYNLTKIINNDSTEITINYYPETLFTKEVIESDGNFTLYEYGADPSDPDNNYWTYVTTLSYFNDTIKNFYSYEIGKDLTTNETFTKRIITEINGIRTETIYNKHGVPIEVKRGGDIITYKYDDLGLLLEKKSEDLLTRIEYYYPLRKISRIENHYFLFDSTHVIQYGYTDGNLTTAISSDGKQVKLIYDSYDRIAEMISQNSHLLFEYNKYGKPIKVIKAGKGEILIDYDDFGEIESVNSKDGNYSLAMEITSEFQSLATLVKPAGVDLSL